MIRSDLVWFKIFVFQFTVKGCILTHLSCHNTVDPFRANVPMLYPLKTFFSGVFRGYKTETSATNGINEYLVLQSYPPYITQKMKFSIKRRKLWIWSHLLKKSLMENFSFVQLSEYMLKDFPWRCCSVLFSQPNTLSLIRISSFNCWLRISTSLFSRDDSDGTRWYAVIHFWVNI